MINEHVKQIDFKTENQLKISEKAYHLANLIKAKLVNPPIVALQSTTEDEEEEEEEERIQLQSPQLQQQPNEVPIIS